MLLGRWIVSRAIRQARLSRVARTVINERLTYLAPERLLTLEAATSHADRRKIPGDYLEMGVALGGSAILLASRLRGNRRFYGYDVFGQIPPPSPRDPADVHARYAEIAAGRSRGIGGDTYYGYVDDLFGQVVASFERHGVPVDGERINLSRGRFEETLRPDRAIAVAHIDCDWHDPVALCLERVWQHLVVDGRIVLDDYNDWRGCRVATDAFLGQHPDAVVVQRVPTVVIQRA